MLLIYMMYMGFTKLLTVSLINIEVCNHGYANILLFMIPYGIQKLKIILIFLQEDGLKDGLKQLVNDGLEQMKSALPIDHSESLAHTPALSTEPWSSIRSLILNSQLTVS